MMPGIRRLIAYAAVTGLLAAGAVSATMEVAHANFANLCDGSGTAPSCTVTGTIPSPAAITVNVTDTGNASEQVTVTWNISCTDNSGTASEPQNGATGTTPFGVELVPLPVTADGQCNVSAVVNLPTSETSSSTFKATPFEAVLNYTPSTSPTATATPTPTPTSSSTAPAVHPIKGYDGKCVDDRRNSSANRAEIIIWTCSSTDQAQNWTFSNGELQHNGKCMNDQGNGGIRSKVILYTCNGASNEKWSELANGELMLKSHGGTLCLDDPHYSTTNRTQLIVYTCKDSANQRWELP
jgi:hypothetical protein